MLTQVAKCSQGTSSINTVDCTIRLMPPLCTQVITYERVRDRMGQGCGSLGVCLPSQLISCADFGEAFGRIKLHLNVMSATEFGFLQLVKLGTTFKLLCLSQNLCKSSHVFVQKCQALHLCLIYNQGCDASQSGDICRIAFFIKCFQASPRGRPLPLPLVLLCFPLCL